MMPYRARQAIQRTRNALAVCRGMAHLDRHDLSGTVLLAGSGRSGTTWISQIINHANAYRDIFEPFHPQRVGRVRDWPAMRYLPAGDDAPEQAQLIRSLLAGQIRSRWTDRYNQKLVSNRRLIKAIRTNLMLGWVRQHCPQVRLLFAMRHPCAVVHSRVKLRWQTHLDELLDQPMLMRNHLSACRETIERAERSNDPWMKHLAMWCIENAVPLRELTPEDAHLLRYEDLCQDFDTQTETLFAYLGQPIHERIDQARRQTSAHFRRDSAVVHGNSLIADWQRHVTPAQIDQTLAMLQAFGLDHLYDAGPLPRCTRDQAFIDRNASLSPVAAPSTRDAA